MTVVAEYTRLQGNDVHIERRGAALWLTMSRPGHENRITPAMMCEMGQALDDAQADDEVRAIVLAADPPVFCLGCDHHELRTLGSDDPAAMRLVEQVKAFCTRLESFSKPIVAVVDGDAKGGGFEMLLACDLIIASDRARVGDAHAGFTMPGAGSVTRSVHKLGGSLARAVQLTGVMLPASAFLGCGFVFRVVSPKALEDAVGEVVSEICSKTPTVSRRLKQALLTAATATRQSALEKEYALFDEQIREPEVTVGMARLNEMLRARLAARL